MKNSNDISIGVVLNVYRRIDNLDSQIKAIKSQSVKPESIIIWNNSDNTVIIDDKEINVIVANSSENMGVWSRFIYSLNLNTQFIAVFDDDTIPGSRWFENCLDNIGDNILLGTRGLIFASDKSYFPYKEYGWNNPNNKMIEVDIVGHAWFFNRKLFDVIFSEFSNRYKGVTSGEDIHLSYSIKKHGGRTFVPPHPKDNLELWGSIPDIANKLGSDSNSISLSVGADDKFEFAFMHYINLGFKLLSSEKKIPSIVISTSLNKNSKLKSIVNNYPRLKMFLVRIKRILNNLGIYFK